MNNRQKFVGRVIAIALILQAIFIGVNGTRDAVLGKPTLDVIQGMIVQGIELIVKANRIRKSFEESDRSPKSPNN